MVQHDRCIDEKLDALQRQINCRKGTSQTPGTSTCCFWHGNKSASDNGLFYFRIDRFENLTALTKEQLLIKMQAYYTNLLNIS